MSLALGTRLGPYEVTAWIGVGRMGEVYRATDTNLALGLSIEKKERYEQQLAEARRDVALPGRSRKPRVPVPGRIPRT